MLPAIILVVPRKNTPVEKQFFQVSLFPLQLYYGLIQF